MKNNKYKVVLTNGKIQNIYEVQVFNKKEAIILAQAEAIKQARGYEFVSITEVED